MSTIHVSQCSSEGMKASFAIDEAMAERLVGGIDDIGITLRHEAKIIGRHPTSLDAPGGNR